MCDTVFPREFFDSEALMSAARLSSGPKLVPERRMADCSSEALTTIIKHISIELKGHTHENLNLNRQYTNWFGKNRTSDTGYTMPIFT
jgi:hypothetical protein